MGSSKPKVSPPLPFQQQTQQQNTYGRFSVADSPEAQSLLNTPLDFGKETNVDPGVGYRTAGREQDVNNRYDSSFMSGVPAWIREINRNKEVRDVQGQGAQEAAQAQYLNQQGNNARQQAMTMADLERKRILLPQYLQTGGSGNTSGYNTQLVQPQPGFWQRAALSAIGGASSGLRFGAGG